MTPAPQLRLRHDPYAELPDGRRVSRWTFGPATGGVRAEVLNLGAGLHALHAPDRHGAFADVVLSPADPAQLLGEARYFGATVGRCANRVARGELPLDGVVHRLETQDDGTTLHGGPHGWDTRIWNAEPIRLPGRVGVRFTLHSPDGDQGFPGAVTAAVRYLLDGQGRLTIDYAARTDAPTVVNLTNHAYFNLAGEGTGTVLDHELQVDAEHYLPVDGALIPLGAPAPVAGTAFDLTAPRRLGGIRPVERSERSERPDRTPAEALADAQLALAGGGFDHNWVLRPAPPGSLRRAAVLRHPASGRALTCLTTEPGVQVYTGGGFDGSVIGRSGSGYRAFGGIALETQHFPDSPHQPAFPSTVLRPGQEYRSTTVYHLAAEPTSAADAGCPA